MPTYDKNDNKAKQGYIKVLVLETGLEAEIHILVQYPEIQTVTRNFSAAAFWLAAVPLLLYTSYK